MQTPATPASASLGACALGHHRWTSPRPAPTNGSASLWRWRWRALRPPSSTAPSSRRSPQGQGQTPPFWQRQPMQLTVTRLMHTLRGKESGGFSRRPALRCAVYSRSSPPAASSRNGMLIIGAHQRPSNSNKNNVTLQHNRKMSLCDHWLPPIFRTAVLLPRMVLSSPVPAARTLHASFSSK